MPVFLARWSNGDISIVLARNKRDAYIQLDEVGDEPAMLWRMPTCLISCSLSDRGTVELEWFGCETLRFMQERSYPTLNSLDWDMDPAQRPLSRPPQRVRDAVRAERDRYAPHKVSHAATPVGQDLQTLMGAGKEFVDLVMLSANQSERPRKNRKPSENSRPLPARAARDSNIGATKSDVNGKRVLV